MCVRVYDFRRGEGFFQEPSHCLKRPLRSTEVEPLLRVEPLKNFYISDWKSKTSTRYLQQSWDSIWTVSS